MRQQVGVRRSQDARSPAGSSGSAAAGLPDATFAEAPEKPHTGLPGVRLATKRTFGRTSRQSIDRLTERHHPDRPTPVPRVAGTSR